MDIYIAPKLVNEELGTVDQPYVADSTTKFDDLMRQHAQRNNHVHLAGGNYKTAGIGQWNRRPGRGFTINGQVTLADDAVVELDIDALEPYDINSEPQQIFMGQGVWDDPDRAFDEFQAMTPEQVFDALPRGQSVKGGTVVGNFSKLQPRFKAAGQSLRVEAVALNGHNASCEGTKLLDFGAYRYDPNIGAEAFPLCIMGATSGFDQNKLAQLNPLKYVFDMEGEPSHISNTSFEGYVPEASNDQVTVRMIVGSVGEPGGFGTGNRKYMWRKSCYQENNITRGSPGINNLIQGHTNYLSQGGYIRGNKSYDCDVLYYGDFLQTENQTIDENEAYNPRHLAVLLLSPTPVALAKDFHHKNYTIGLNKCVNPHGGTDVLINELTADWVLACQKAGVDPATGKNRFISGIKVHRTLSVNPGAPFTPFGTDLNARSGCRRFF